MPKLLLLLCITCLAPGISSAADGPGEWGFGLTPYLWLPVIDGTLKYDIPPGAGGSPNFEVGPTDWLDLLNYGLLLSGSATKDRFTIFSDLVILSMTSKNDGRLISIGQGSGGLIPIGAELNLDTRTDLDGLSWTVAAGYLVQDDDNASMTLFAGARLFSIEADTGWDLTAEVTGPMNVVVLPSAGSIGADKDLWDGIVGIKGSVALGTGKWSVPYYLDLGAGSSDLTWNAVAGLSYAFGWGDLVFAYRHLEYDQGSDKLLNDFSFSGLAIGGRFRF